MIAYETVIPVRFNHVDAAGIVFYPRYFEMVNQTVEQWFEADLGLPFAEMHKGARSGVPTVDLDFKFRRPSRLGDRLHFRLSIRALGRSSATLWLTVTGPDADDLRMEGQVTLVYVEDNNGTYHAADWPVPVRERMMAMQEKEEGVAS